MKTKKIFLIIISMLWISLCNLNAQDWSEVKSIPTARWTPASVELDGKIYVLGGQGEDPPYRALNTFEAYDPVSDSWNSLPNMPTGRWGLSAAVVDGKIYAIGGMTGSFLGGFSSTDVVEEYDPNSNTWTTKSPLQVGRGYGGCVVYNDTIFVFGGYRTQSGADLGTVEKYYPPSDIWVSSGIAMPTLNSTFMMTKVNNSAYMIGGWGNSDVYEYNFLNGEWSPKSQMPVAAGGSGIAVYDSLIFVAGGRGGDSNELREYNTTTDVWTMILGMPTAREGLVAGIVDQSLYCITGSDPDGLPFYKTNEKMNLFLLDVDDNNGLPKNLSLSQNYPNPFNPSTTIQYYLPGTSDVVLKIFNILGKEVKTLADEIQTSGNKTYTWNGKSNNGITVPSGVYFYRLTYKDKTFCRKMMLVK